MVPSTRKRSPDLITLQHLKENFRIKTEKEAGLLHKALYHFYGRGDPQQHPDEKLSKRAILGPFPTKTEFSEIGFLVKVNVDGKVLEISQHLVMKE